MTTAQSNDDTNPEAEPALTPENSRKRKTLLELFKEWAGVITIVITLFYTYPLGFWDRFVITKQERQAKEIEHVRDLVIRLAELDSEYMRSIVTLQDPNSKNGYTYAMTTRKTALVARELPTVLEHYKNLTPLEIGLLANQLLVLGDVDRAKEMFDTAIEGAKAAKSPAVMSEIYRLSARQYLIGSPLGVNVGKARDAFQQAWDVLRPGPQKKGLAVQAYSVVSDWSALEGNFGDPACALDLARIAIPLLQAISPADLAAARAFVDSFKPPPTGKCAFQIQL
jgi:hypothetical protein